MTEKNHIEPGYNSDKFWNYHPPLPLKFAPYFDRPVNIKAIVGYWLKTWNPRGTQFLFLLIAFMVWLFFTPSLERTATFSFDWIFEIWLRDMILILTIAGGLHLYLHTFKCQGTELKYDKRELEKNSRRFHFKNQNWDNMFWTLTTGVGCWVFWESLLLWAFANGYATLISFEGNPVWFVVLLAIIPLWSYSFFDFQHRILHRPWLYKHVHSWHHKNGNTGPWSGLAMHPLEQFILMSDTLLFFLISAHPVHVIYSLIFHGLGAPTSHTGYHKVTLGKFTLLNVGDFYHQLHHRFFDTNYGTLDTPGDLIFDRFHNGTLEGNKRMMEMRKRQAS
ncbi:MAG: sterol desaturase family protein [Pseudomonadota bacterium]